MKSRAQKTVQLSRQAGSQVLKYGCITWN